MASGAASTPLKRGVNEIRAKDPKEFRLAPRRPSQDLFPLWSRTECDIVVFMTTLDEIETAAAALSDAEKQHLMRFLAARLQAQGAPPPETPFLSREKMTDWMAEDEAAMRRVRPGPQG
jgi:hypothetical protein